MSNQAEDQDQATSAQPPEHPKKADGTPYAFGGYAFLRLGCRCEGCLAAQSATAKSGNRAQKKAQPRAARARDNLRSVDGGAAAASAVVTDLASEARTRARTPRGGASQADLENIVGQALVYASIAYVWLAGRDLPLPDEVTDGLSLRDDEAADIAAPLARAFATSELNARYGRGVVENADVPVAIFALGMYARRVNRTLATFRRELGRQAAPTPTPTGGPHHAPQPTAGPGPAADSSSGGGGAEEQEIPPPRFVGQPFAPGQQLLTD